MRIQTFKITIEGERASGKSYIMMLLLDAMKQHGKFRAVEMRLDKEATEGPIEIWNVEVVR